MHADIDAGVRYKEHMHFFLQHSIMQMVAPHNVASIPARQS